MLCGAQATSLTVDNKVAGTLSQRILYDDKLTVENLKLIGEVNADDFEYLDELNSKYNLTGVLDMAEVNIVSGGRFSGYGSSYISSSNNTLNVMMFKTSKRLRKLILPRTITAWNDGSYYVANGSAGTATCYPNLNADSLVIECPNLRTVGNGIGTPSYLYVGEGVESLYWGSKYMNRLPGSSDDYYEKYTDSVCVHLPASLTSLYGNSRMGTPKVKIYSKIIRPDNLYAGSNKWYNDVLTDGVVYAPNDTKELYENSIFKHLVIIAPISVKSVSLNIQTLFLKVNNTYDLFATVSPKDADVKTVVWSSSDESVARVDENGNILALKRGDAIITATSEDNPLIKDECTVTVLQPVETIIVTPNQLNLNIGESKELEVKIQPDNANNPSVKWVSSNEYVVKVSENGSIVAMSKGTAIVTATSLDNPSLYDKCAITVIQPVEAISLSENTLSLRTGESKILSATILPLTADNKNVTWKSSDATIATVDNNGKIKAIKGGEATIIVSSVENPEINDECAITVIQPITSIAMSKSALELTEDDSEQLTVLITPDDATNKSVNWTSSDVSVAMVSPDGTVYAIKPGQATIMATTVDGGFVALCKVTVKAKVIVAESLTLSPTIANLTVGETFQLRAVVSPENTTNKDVRWTSTNTDVAVVSESGLVSAIKEGDVQIIASTTDGSNLSAICEISVNSRFVSITQIAISPSSAKLAVGETFNLEAQITPGDATNKTINWSSTNPSVVIVDSNGQLTAKGIGTATIIASSQDGTNLSAICNVEVFEPMVLISSITIDPTAITGKVGETYQLTVTVTPENASDKALAWSSDNSGVASVDSDGLITLHTNGNAKIKASATDGSGISATCAVVVDVVTGMNHIEVDSNEFVKIYNLCGILVYEGKYSESNLVSGTYIIISQGNTIKRIIR